MSEFLPCLTRQRVERFEKDGAKGEFHQCANVIASRYTKPITPSECAACPVRSGTVLFTGQSLPSGLKREWEEPTLEADGTIRYARRGIEPPPEHEGYQRKSEDIDHEDAWAFVPVFLPCQHREMVNSLRPSGCLKINAVCVSKDSGKELQIVTVADCAACPVRQAAKS